MYYIPGDQGHITSTIINTIIIVVEHACNVQLGTSCMGTCDYWQAIASLVLTFPAVVSCAAGE